MTNKKTQRTFDNKARKNKREKTKMTNKKTQRTS